MKLQTFLKIATLLYAVFGLGLLVIPGPFMATYGVELTAGGILMARVLGSALLGFALVFWWSDADPSGSTLAILKGSFIYNVIDIPIVALATLGGVMNPMGWMPVGLHVFLAAGFGYFAFRR